MDHCTRLHRARVYECQKDYSKRCAPIDRNYPGKWYLPCYEYLAHSGKIERSGAQGTIKHRIPETLSCEQCVLHWYWTTENNCSPPGFIYYYDGQDRLRGWGNCPTQGGTHGGFSRNQKACGGREKMLEEYISCAYIRINSRPLQPPQPTKPKRRNRKRLHRHLLPSPLPHEENLY